MTVEIELTEHGRFLFQSRDGARNSGVVEELTETSALIRWDGNGNAVWYPLSNFKSLGFLEPMYDVIEKLKPR